MAETALPCYHASRRTRLTRLSANVTASLMLAAIASTASAQTEISDTQADLSMPDDGDSVVVQDGGAVERDAADAAATLDAGSISLDIEEGGTVDGGGEKAIDAVDGQITNQGDVLGDVAVEQDASIDNEDGGTITGTLTLGNGNDHSNEGTIEGGVTASGDGGSLNNTGTILDQITAEATDFELNNSGTIEDEIALSGDEVDLSNTSTIEDVVTATGSDFTISNSDRIEGDDNAGIAVESGATGGQITNDGVVAGNEGHSAIHAEEDFDLDGSGVLETDGEAGISLSDGAGVTLDGEQSVDGSDFLISGDDDSTISVGQSGVAEGDIDTFGDLTNEGEIVGRISSGESFDNEASGQMSGDVASVDEITNEGEIDGSIEGFNEVTNEGEITGTISNGGRLNNEEGAVISDDVSGIIQQITNAGQIDASITDDVTGGDALVNEETGVVSGDVQSIDAISNEGEIGGSVSGVSDYSGEGTVLGDIETDASERADVKISGEAEVGNITALGQGGDSDGSMVRVREQASAVDVELGEDGSALVSDQASVGNVGSDESGVFLEASDESVVGHISFADDADIGVTDQASAESIEAGDRANVFTSGDATVDGDVTIGDDSRYAQDGAIGGSVSLGENARHEVSVDAIAGTESISADSGEAIIGDAIGGGTELTGAGQPATVLDAERFFGFDEIRAETDALIEMVGLHEADVYMDVDTIPENGRSSNLEMATDSGFTGNVEFSRDGSRVTMNSGSEIGGDLRMTGEGSEFTASTTANSPAEIGGDMEFAEGLTFRSILSDGELSNVEADGDIHIASESNVEVEASDQTNLEVGQDYRILTASGEIQGEEFDGVTVVGADGESDADLLPFATAGLSQGDDFVDVRLDYDEDSDLRDAAETSNSSAVAEALNSSDPVANSGFQRARDTLVSATTVEEAGVMLDGLSGEIHASYLEGMGLAGQQASSAITDRRMQSQLGEGQRGGAWVTALGGQGELDDDDSAQADYDHQGMILGIEGYNGPWTFGGTFTQLDVDVDRTGDYDRDNADSSGYALGGYFGYDAESAPFGVTGFLNYGQQEVDTQRYRTTSGEGSSEPIEASYDADTLELGLTAHTSIDLAEHTRLVPSVGVAYYQVDREGFTESGDGALDVSATKFERTDATFGLELQHTYLETQDWRVDGRVGAKYDTALSSDTPDLDASFVDDRNGGSFTVDGAQADDNRGRANVGVSAQSQDGRFGVSADYQTGFDSDLDDEVRVQGEVRW